MPKPPKNRRRVRPLDARVALSLAATGLSCTPAGPAPVAPPATIEVPPPPAEATASASAAPAAPPADDAAVAGMVARLREQAVVHDRFGRRTLYTWTTREQIDELMAQRVLLTRTESPVHGSSFSDQILASYALAGDKLAMQVRTAAFAKARFAWTTPWATLLGWPGESYGDRLIEVELKPEAWIVRVLQSRQTIDAYDLDGRLVQVEEVLKHPERIAAVYFVHDIPDREPWGSFAGPNRRPAYREYILCNESMIARWAVGTPAMARAVEEGIALLDALHAVLARQPPFKLDISAWNLQAAQAWGGSAPLDTIDLAFAAAIPFPNETYRPRPENVAAILAALRKLPAQGPTMEHRPTAIFPRAAAAKPLPPPKVKPRPRGTY